MFLLFTQLDHIPGMEHWVFLHVKTMNPAIPECDRDHKQRSKITLIYKNSTSLM